MHSDLSPQQNVELFPSYIYKDCSTQQWTLPFSAFVYDHGQDGVRRRVFLRLLRQVLDLPEDQLQTSECFQDRIVGFLNTPQRGVSLGVHLDDDKIVGCGKSRRSGHVRCSIPIPETRLPANLEDNSPVPLSQAYSLALRPGDERSYQTSAEFIPPNGVSVITDIDDTIKISQVAHRRQLLHNTFLHPFVSVPGMSQLYQHWQEAGYSFHYVSSSPWQLFRPLYEFLKANQFPRGSFHLRAFRFGDPSVLKLLISSKRNKFKIISTILKHFPNRKFIFVGDSGEKDAEVYGKVARKFPDQTLHIFIRLVEGRPWTKKRVAKAFRHVPEDRWQTFHVPTQIPDLALS